MSPRFICPHCHRSIDPLTLEVAASAEVQYRICTECDSPIVLSIKTEDTEQSLIAPRVEAPPATLAQEHCVL